MSVEEDLALATRYWLNPTVARTYPNTADGHRVIDAEVAILGSRGYVPSTASSDGGHVNLGRTVTGAALTGGISLLLGGSRAAGTVLITFARQVGDEDDPAELVRILDAFGWVPSFAGASQVVATVEDVRSHGRWNAKVIVRALVTNVAATLVDDCEVLVAQVKPPSPDPEFHVRIAGSPGCFVYLSSTFGAQISEAQRFTGQLQPDQGRTIEWDLGGGLNAQGAVILAIPRRVLSGGLWSDPRPTTANMTVATNQEVQSSR